MVLVDELNQIVAHIRLVVDQRADLAADGHRTRPIGAERTMQQTLQVDNQLLQLYRGFMILH